AGGALGTLGREMRDEGAALLATLRAALIAAAVALGTLGCGRDARLGEVGIYDEPISIEASDNHHAGSAGAAGSVINVGDAALSDGPWPPEYVLAMTIRDFRFYDAMDLTTDPDFDNPLVKSRLDLQIVADTLGSDSKPLYRNPTGMTPTTHG